MNLGLKYLFIGVMIFSLISCNKKTAESKPIEKQETINRKVLKC